MKRLILFFAIAILLPTGFVEATPIQQYNKIFINPFYRESMTKNLNHTFNITVNPPDNIAKVISAIINLNLYITSSPQKFELYVNGKSCNNPTWTGTSPGFATASFDCSNVITKSGTYSFVINSAKDTGSLTGWLDLTYINNPAGGLIQIHGTEYYLDEYATIFLQLKDNTGNPVNNGNCYLNIWYPPMPNSSHAIFLNKAPMLFKNGSQGIYYYDLYVPNVTGNYMLSAECSYTYTAKWYYPPILYEPPFIAPKPNRTIVYGTFIGDTILLNDYEDWLYTQCSSQSLGGAKYCNAYYDYGLENTTITSLELFWMGETSSPVTIDFYIWNWTGSSWIKLLNSITTKGTAQTSGYPTGIDEFVSNNIPALNDTIAANKTVRIRILAQSGSTFSEFDNWLALKATQEGTFIQEIKGSGEMHVHGAINITTNNTEIINKINQINSSIFSKLYKMQDEITSINDTVKEGFNKTYNYLIEHNSSIWNKLHNIQEELQNISDELSNITNTDLETKITSVNNTVKATNTSIFTKLYSIQNELAEINTSIINHDIEVIGKLYSIQNNLTNISSQILGINSSIFWKLYAIQDEISSVNETININFQNLNQNIQNNFTHTNNLINFWGNALNSTINWWGIYQSAVLQDLNNTINWWGNFLDGWFWEIEHKLDNMNITIGNFTANYTVDYDEIAITVMQYLKALQKQKLI